MNHLETRSEDRKDGIEITPDKDELLRFWQRHHEDDKLLLPQECELQKLVYFFFVRWNQQFCSPLHKPTFVSDLAEGKVDAFLLLAMCALSATSIAEAGPDAGEVYAENARKLVPSRLIEPSRANVLGFLFLSMYEFCSLTSQRAWVYTGIAVRLAQLLRLSRGIPSLMSWKEQELGRRCFWAAFIFDRFLSGCESRPFIIDIENINIRLPEPENDFLFEQASEAEYLENWRESPSDTKSITAWLLRLVPTWTKVTAWLSGGGRQRDPNPPWDPNSKFHSFRQELQDWCDRLPESLRFSPKNVALQSALDVGFEFYQMHIIYFQALCLLHREYLPCTTEWTVHRDGALLDLGLVSENLIKPAISSADAIFEIVQQVDLGKSLSPLSPWIGFALFGACAVRIWENFFEDSPTTALTTSQIDYGLAILRRLSLHWHVADAWLNSLFVVHDLYASIAFRNGKEAHLVSLPISRVPVPPPASSSTYDQVRVVIRDFFANFASSQTKVEGSPVEAHFPPTALLPVPPKPDTPSNIGNMDENSYDFLESIDSHAFFNSMVPFQEDDVLRSFENWN